jgi:hypothetical protein
MGKSINNLEKVISKDEYEKVLIENLKEAKEEYELLLETYAEYLDVREKFHLKYFISNGSYSYIKKSKRQIGFKYGQKRLDT